MLKLCEIAPDTTASQTLCLHIVYFLGARALCNLHALTTRPFRVARRLRTLSHPLGRFGQTLQSLNCQDHISFTSKLIFKDVIITLNFSATRCSRYSALKVSVENCIFSSNFELLPFNVSVANFRTFYVQKRLTGIYHICLSYN